MAKQLRVLSIRKETQKSDLSGQYIKEVQDSVQIIPFNNKVQNMPSPN